MTIIHFICNVNSGYPYNDIKTIIVVLRPLAYNIVLYARKFILLFYETWHDHVTKYNHFQEENLYFFSMDYSTIGF